MSTRPIAVGPDRWEPSSTRAPGELKAGAGPSTALRAGGGSGGIGKSPPHAAGPSTTLRAGRPPPRGHRPFDYAQGRLPTFSHSFMMPHQHLVSDNNPQYIPRSILHLAVAAACCPIPWAAVTCALG